MCSKYVTSSIWGIPKDSINVIQIKMLRNYELMNDSMGQFFTQSPVMVKLKPLNLWPT